MHSEAGAQLSLPAQTNRWPRTVYANAVTRLHDAGARLIVLDIAFREARTELEDQQFQEALTQAGNVLLFTYMKRYQVPTGVGVADIEQKISPIARFRKPALGYGPFVLPRHPERVAQTDLLIQQPDGPAASQPLLAYLALQPPTAVERWRQHYSSSNYPSPHYLGKQLASLAASHNVRHTLRGDGESLTPQQIPMPLRFNFYGPSGTLTTYGLHQVMQASPESLREWFDGKVVFLGFAEQRQTEQKDVYRTVFSDSKGMDLSGMEISATALANLLTNDYLRPAPPWLLSVLTAAAFVLGFLLAASLWRMLLLGLISAAYAALAYGLFVAHYWWLPMALPLLAAAAGVAACFVDRYYQVKRRAEAITGTLQNYLPEQAARQLSYNIATLEHQHQVVSGICLMTDVGGYTSLAEKLAPCELHQLMNRYYAELIDEVKSHGGFVANLVGDSLTALWIGAEIDADMCQKALSCARAIDQRINHQPSFQTDLPTYMALHGGQFSLGNLGAIGHFEYSPVGDIINTTARVEHFNRTLKTSILCTDVIAGPIQAKNSFELKYLGSFKFRNKNNNTCLYTPM